MNVDADENSDAMNVSQNDENNDAMNVEEENDEVSLDESAPLAAALR